MNVPVVALALVATWLIRPANDPDPSKRWDAVSSILVMIGLVGTVVAIKEIGHAPPSVATIVVALLVAAIGFWLFVRRQRRLENPLLEFSIFLNPAFSAGVLAAAFAMFAIGGIQLVTTQRFQQVVGFSPLEAGLFGCRDCRGLVADSAPEWCLLAPCRAARADHRWSRRRHRRRRGDGSRVPIILRRAGSRPSGDGCRSRSCHVGRLHRHHRERAGAPCRHGRFLEEVSYEFGSLIAVSVLGSLLTAIYTASVVLPNGAPAAAGDGIAEALEAAQGDAAIIQAASTAFDSAYLVVMLVVAGVLAAAAVITGVLLRRYLPGTQSQLHSEH